MSDQPGHELCQRTMLAVAAAIGQKDFADVIGMIQALAGSCPPCAAALYETIQAGIALADQIADTWPDPAEVAEALVSGRQSPPGTGPAPTRT